MSEDTKTETGLPPRFTPEQQETVDMMTAAGRGAMYVLSTDHTGEGMTLANRCHRPDLRIVGPGVFRLNGFYLRGHLADVVLDHATKLNDEQKRVLKEYNAIKKARLK